MASRVLYLVRHGQHRRLPQEEASTEQPNRSDGGLTSLGRKQAELTGRRLILHPIGAIHCSSLPRASETAEIIAKEFPGVTPRRSCVLWECVPSVPSQLSALFPGMSCTDVAGGRERAEKAYARYFKSARGVDKHEVLVCHGNLIRYFVTRVLDVESDAWVRLGTFNCGITEVRVNGSWQTLVSHNDCGHLPVGMRT
jgi:serine/threonine-protein phosphatase PGAM5